MRLPLWAVRLLTGALERWHREYGGTIAEAADYFGVTESDIRSAMNLTGTIMGKKDEDDKKDGKVIAPGRSKEELQPGPRPPPGSKPEPVPDQKKD